jgi:starvation-inducible DNA-binding protein
MEELLRQLRVLQASNFTYYTKAHGYHWNVEGILFDQFHEMFSDIYNDVWQSIDGYAEWIRVFGSKAVFDMPSMINESEVTYDLGLTGNPMEMLGSLNASNYQIIGLLKIAFQTAEENNEQGLADFLASRIESPQKWSWKISSSLKSVTSN